MQNHARARRRKTGGQLPTKTKKHQRNTTRRVAIATARVRQLLGCTLHQPLSSPSPSPAPARPPSVKRPCLYPLFFGGEAKGEFWAGLFACAFALAKDEFLLLFLGLLFCLCLEALLLRYPRLLLRATQDPGEERERVGGREAGRVWVRVCVCVRVCECVCE
jgi:hypothetical protein